MPKVFRKLPTPDQQGWEQREVRLTIDDSGKRVKLIAWALGTLVVHKAFDREDAWSVSHLPTGLQAAMNLRSEIEARRVGNTLWERCRLALEKKTRGEVLKDIPSWVRGWIQDMVKTRVWEDPIPF